MSYMDSFWERMAQNERDDRSRMIDSQRKLVDDDVNVSNRDERPYGYESGGGE